MHEKIYEKGYGKNQNVSLSGLVYFRSFKFDILACTSHEKKITVKISNI